MAIIDSLLLAALLLSCAPAPGARAADVECGAGVEYVPHPTDCALFYACQAGEPVLESCPAGLWWNPNTDQCDWPDVAFCSVGSTSPTSSTSTTDDGSSTSSTSSTPSTTVDSPCVGNEPEFFPHPTDCTLFYKCYQGEAQLESCPPGLWWHQSAGACDWPDEAFCTPGSSTTSSTATSTSTSTGSTSSPGPGPAMPCPAVDTEAVRYPHLTNCQLYYLCVGGVTKLYTCSPGEEFDPIARHCSAVDAAGCSQCPAAPVSGGVVRLAHESQCHLYYRCEGTAPALYQCQQDQQFSRFDRQCHPLAEAFCSL